MTIETEDDVRAFCSRCSAPPTPGERRSPREAPEPPATSIHRAAYPERRHVHHDRTSFSTRSRVVSETSDGWSLVGAPANLSAQYEHTMIITRGEPAIVTQH